MYLSLFAFVVDIRLVFVNHVFSCWVLHGSFLVVNKQFTRGFVFIVTLCVFFVEAHVGVLLSRSCFVSATHTSWIVKISVPAVVYKLDPGVIIIQRHFIVTSGSSFG